MWLYRFPEVDYKLGTPQGKLAEESKPGSNIWRRAFASDTIVTYDNNKLTGKTVWAGQK